MLDLQENNQTDNKGGLNNRLPFFPELLSPAGNIASAYGALNAGADAVYLGASVFSARAFAENGIAACVFDFIGGGEGSRSEGVVRDMSVLTEAADLSVVIDSLKQREEFNPERIFLLGRSQGGFVATYVAEERPRDICALILLFPGFVISDDMREFVPDPEEIPDSLELMGATIGKLYLEDALSVDIYEKMGDYPGDVLIFHGTADSIVPLSYSERAVTTFPSAELVTIEGAGHGFSGEDDQYVTKRSVDFVKAHLDTAH